MEHRLGQVGSVVMGFLEGRLESLMEEEREGTSELSSSLEAETSDASGDDQDDQGGDMVSRGNGASPQASMRGDSPMLREEGLIAQMEREVEEAGLGG